MYSEDYDFVSNSSNSLSRKNSLESHQPPRKKRRLDYSETEKSDRCESLGSTYTQSPRASVKRKRSKKIIEWVYDKELINPETKHTVKRGRKKQKLDENKTPYSWTIDYNNDGLAEVRYPDKYSVPDHLKEEFITNKHILFPNNEKKTNKYELEPRRVLSGVEREYVSWLSKFWTPDRLNTIVDILVPNEIESNSITLSLIDWLCINYSKVHKITYKTDTELDFELHCSYKRNLDAFFRPYFDVFRRGPRVLVEYVDDECKIAVLNPDSLEIQWDTKRQVGVRMINGKKMVYLVTSVGQLNFFRWAITNRVIEYCEDNIDKIRSHMGERKNKPTPRDGKRRKLTENPRRSWFIKKVSIVLDYDFLDDELVAEKHGDSSTAPQANDETQTPENTQNNEDSFFEEWVNSAVLPSNMTKFK